MSEEETEPLTFSFEVIDATPELQLIQLLMEASERFDDVLTQEQKNRAVNYFCSWYKQTNG